jgi:hypothetical protein
VQRLLAAETQLQRSATANDFGQTGIILPVEDFILGRGLTLVLAVVAAVVIWLAIQFVWWLFSHYAVTKEPRRGSLWYRLLSYSFYLVTIVFCIVTVLAVLYARDDLPLLVLALLGFAITALSIRKYIPPYVRKTRLLLDLVLCVKMSVSCITLCRGRSRPLICRRYSGTPHSANVCCCCE